MAAEIARAFLAFEASYPHKWATKPRAIEVWSEMLDELEPEEIRAAVASWCKTHDWPPSPAELRGMVPRFCRCGRCWACHSRAVERAKRAIDRGAIGADFDGPTHITEIAPSKAPRLGEGQRRLGQ